MIRQPNIHVNFGDTVESKHGKARVIGTFEDPSHDGKTVIRSADVISDDRKIVNVACNDLNIIKRAKKPGFLNL
tara:strand:- start:914 stop:1135 length:222 start_codon:yes stop_codon:yes gene_type:complete